MSTNSVIVTNKGKQSFEARYGGEDYEFPPGRAVPISAEAAAHIFCYGIKGTKEQVEKLVTDCCHRHGFHVKSDGEGNQTGSVTYQGMAKRLGDFEIVGAKLVAADAPSRRGGAAEED